MNTLPLLGSLRQFLPALRPAAHPQALHDAWRLSDGRAVRIRAVRADDGPKMQAMVRSASTTSRYHRFFYAAHELPPDVLARFSHADPLHALTLLATVKEDGEEIVVGMGQYVTDDHAERAEFALMVTDAWQRRGIARRLLQNLSCIARGAGIVQLTGEVLAENHAMQLLLMGMDFALDAHVDGPQVLRATKILMAPAGGCSPLAGLVAGLGDVGGAPGGLRRSA